MVKDSKRIIILTADAGFGHRRAAEALEAALIQTLDCPNDVAIFNPFQDPYLPEILKQLESGYDEMVTDDPVLYQLAYAATDAPVVAQLVQDIATTALNRTMRNLLERHDPQIILTTYPAYTQAAIRTAQEMGKNIPVDVVVTDLIGVHTLWFHEKAAMTFVPTEYVHQQAIENGLSPQKIQLTGLPVHPRIANDARDKVAIRKELGWDPALTTALIVGSARSGQTAQIARLLDLSGLELQISALSGGDQEAEAQLKSTQWKGIVHTYGLVNNIPEMMRAADFIVCKAGGLIVTEAMASGLPLILYEALPGQEVGNVRYVVENGAGVWSPGAIGVLTTAYSWLAGDGSELEKRRVAARRAGRPNSALDVAGFVAKQIHSS
jgi:1,2-diacylglycerol 3-beta-galactosyltransferase